MNSLIALDQFTKLLEKHLEDEFEFDKHKKIIFWGVKSLGHGNQEFLKKENAGERLSLYRFVSDLIDRITPRQLINIFPITKEYDGHKYEMKDYFYAMDKCKEHGLDKPIGNSFEFLWDYWNRDVGSFVVNYLSTLSDVTKRTTGQGLMETYLAEAEIPTYTEKVINGKRVLVENLTFNSKGKLI